MHLQAFGDDPARWMEISGWLRCRSPDEATCQACRLEGLKPHGAGWIVKLAGIDDRSAAETAVGDYLAVERGNLPDTLPGEYYWADLIGLPVTNIEGVELGTVTTLIETGGNTVLVVKDGERERLLPFVESVVRRVDPIVRRIEADWGADW